MTTFIALLVLVGAAYRVFVKGESIIVKNPNWKMRGLAILVVGLSLAALSAYGLIEMYIRYVPIPIIMWVMLAAGVFVTALGVRTMKRLSPSQLAD